MMPARTGIASLAIAILAGTCMAPAAQSPQTAHPPASAVLEAPRRLQLEKHVLGISLVGEPGQGAVLHGRLSDGAHSPTLDGMPIRVASDGAFLIGFGRDAGPASVLRAVLPGGEIAEMRLTVAPRAWHVETVGSVPKHVQPEAEFVRLRGPEIAQINAARRVDPVSDGWRQAFIWPGRGRVSGLFGSQRVYKNGEKGDPHSGVDVALPVGTPVVAPAEGVVVLAADHPFTLEGNLLMIDHGMGLNSAFLHLSRIDVQLGDHVRQGQRVGAVGMTGRASGPHLHWGMKWLDRRIDPLLLVGPMR